ncbi:MAG: hypothetical protein ABIC91_04165 [Nanoarchaeota archaeon]|nr:hypothetical protein [Nanoarchaeota archaeon]MBU1031281.1 hypothetical protein [Nanoarchaeota archaeon]MBU1849511.1 hypothetical protein [Nanoarchaeota archaeon]
MTKPDIPIEDFKLKKEEMETGITYLLCPDVNCNLFWDDLGPVPCESNCPRQKDLVKILYCNRCNDLVELPGTHHLWQRVDHLCPVDQLTFFELRKTSYRIIFEKPM